MKKQISFILAAISLMTLSACGKKTKTSSESISSVSSSVNSSFDSEEILAQQAYRRYHKAMSLLEKCNSSYQYYGAYGQIEGTGVDNIVTKLDVGHYYKEESDGTITLNERRQGTKNRKQYDLKINSYDYTIGSYTNKIFAQIEKEDGVSSYYSYALKDTNGDYVFADEKLTSLSLLYKAYPYISSSSNLKEEIEVVDDYLSGINKNKNYTIELQHDGNSLDVKFTEKDDVDSTYCYYEILRFKNDQLSKFESKKEQGTGDDYICETRNYSISFTSPTAWSSEFTEEEVTSLEKEIFDVTISIKDPVVNHYYFSVTSLYLDELLNSDKYSFLGKQIMIDRYGNGSYTYFKDYSKENLELYFQELENLGETDKSVVIYLVIKE